MRTPTVFFDLDGTLIDSVHDVHLCLNSVLKEHGRKELSLAVVTSLVGGGAQIMAHKALEMTGGVENKSQVGDVAEEFLCLYRNNPVRLSKIFPGGTNLLETLQGENVQLAAGTTAAAQTTAQLQSVPHLLWHASSLSSHATRATPGTAASRGSARLHRSRAAAVSSVSRERPRRQYRRRRRGGARRRLPGAAAEGRARRRREGCGTDGGRRQ